MKKKALILLIIIVIAAILIYVYLPPAKPKLVIDQVYGVTEPGRSILINITLVNSPGCSGWKINLAWDPYILAVATGDPNGIEIGGTYYNIYEGPFLKSIRQTQPMLPRIDNAEGRIMGLGFGYYPIIEPVATGTGVLVTINFTVLHVGTTTIEIIGPGTPQNQKQAIIADAKNLIMEHDEVYGLVTDKEPPPIWMSTDFQIQTIVVEVIILGVISSIVIWIKHPKKPKVEKAKEIEPVYETET